MRRALSLLSPPLLSLPLLLAAAPSATAVEGTGVDLEGLNKITARVFAIEVPLGQTVRFGSLEITARKCVATDTEEGPERTAFLEIVEEKPGQAPHPVFAGWMFSSSPSVSAMEHPVYDVWVVGCSGLPAEVEADLTPEGPVDDSVAPPEEGVERPLD